MGSIASPSSPPDSRRGDVAAGQILGEIQVRRQIARAARGRRQHFLCGGMPAARGKQDHQEKSSDVFHRTDLP